MLLVLNNRAMFSGKRRLTLVFAPNLRKVSFGTFLLLPNNFYVCFPISAAALDLMNLYHFFFSFPFSISILLYMTFVLIFQLQSDLSFIHIHVIFSSSQIGRFGISQREIGVSDREIFAR